MSDDRLTPSLALTEIIKSFGVDGNWYLNVLSLVTPTTLNVPLYNEELIPETMIRSSLDRLCLVFGATVKLAMSASARISDNNNVSLCKSPTILNSGVLGSKSFLSGKFVISLFFVSSP